jgi:2'-5' RNA ligase
VESFLPLSNVICTLANCRTVGRTSTARRLGPDKDRRYTPHLTLTMRLDKGQAQALLEELRQGEWHAGRWVVPLEHLWLMQRGPGDPAWRYIYRVNLQGAGQWSAP